MRVNGKEYSPKTSTALTDTTTEQRTTNGAQPTPPTTGGYPDNVPTEPQANYGSLNDAKHPTCQGYAGHFPYNSMHAPGPLLHGGPTTPQLQPSYLAEALYTTQSKVSEQGITGGHAPQDTDNEQAQPQKQQRKTGMTRTQLIQAMVGYLAYNYFLIRDVNGAYFLQNRFNLTLYPISSDAFYVPMKNEAMHRYGKELTDGMIKSAVDLFCGHLSPMVPGAIRCSRRFSLLGHVLYYCSTPGLMRELRYDPDSGPYLPPFITQPPPLMINRSASSNYVGNPQVPSSVLENLFRGYSVPEGEYLVLITWMVSTLITPSGVYLLELIGDDNERVQKIQRDLKRLIDPCTQDFLPEVPTQRKQFDTLALDHDLLNFSPVDELSVSMQKNLLDLLNGYRVDVGLKPKRHSYSVFVQRPVLLSADESVITHGPLLDRTITLYLSRTTSPENMDMSIPFCDYSNAWLNLASYVNYWMGQRYDKNATPLETFREVGRLVCTALGKDEQLFLQEVAQQASTRQELSLSESPVAQALITYFDLKATPSESLSATEWLNELEPFCPKRVPARDWPASPRALGAAFKQAQPVLAAAGIECLGEKRGSFRVWTVQRQYDVTDDSSE